MPMSLPIAENQMKALKSFLIKLLTAIALVTMNTNCAVAADVIVPFTTVLKTGTLHPPNTWNSNLPLSDQSNKSHWVFNPAFSDEFRSTTLNTQKWFNYDPKAGMGVLPVLTVPTANGIEFHIRKGRVSLNKRH